MVMLLDLHSTSPSVWTQSEAHMASVIGGGEDAEEVHAIQVIGAEKIQFAICIHSVGTEFETAALITGVHGNGEERARLQVCKAVASDLHTDHGTCQDHMDGFRNIDQLAHTELVEQRSLSSACLPLPRGASGRCVKESRRDD